MFAFSTYDGHNDATMTLDGLVESSNPYATILLWITISIVYKIVLATIEKEKDCRLEVSIRPSSTRRGRFFHCRRRARRRHGRTSAHPGSLESDSRGCRCHCPLQLFFSSNQLPPPLPFRRRRRRKSAAVDVEQQPPKSTSSEVRAVPQNVQQGELTTAALCHEIPPLNESTTVSHNPVKQKKEKKHFVGPTPLIDLARSHAWSQLIDRLSTHRREARHMDADGLLALHWACSGNPPLKVVKALLKAYKRSIKVVDSDGSNALHFACYYGGSADVVRCLLNAHPDAVRGQDIYGRTPLYCAVDRSAGLDVLKVLLLADSTMVTLPCVLPGKSGTRYRQYQRTPLMVVWNAAMKYPSSRRPYSGKQWDKAMLLLHAAYCGAIDGASEKREFRFLHATVTFGHLLPHAVIETALALQPDEARIKEARTGLLPLALVAACTEAWDPCRRQKVIHSLLHAFPGAARIADNNGRVPLVLAIASGKTWNSGVEQLFQAAPERLFAQDPLTGLFPAQLAACAEVSELQQENDHLQFGCTANEADELYGYHSPKCEALRESLQEPSSNDNALRQTGTECLKSRHVLHQLSTIYQLLRENPAAACVQ